jgi:hypothetical protein
MKFLKGLFSLIIIVILLLVGVGGYLGIIPGVSKIFGSDKPRDLGKMYSEENYVSGIQKSGSTRGVLSTSSLKNATIMYEGSHKVDTSFSDEELTSFAYNRPWVNYPFKNVQIRINADNTAEASGIVRMPIITTWLNAIGVSDDQLQKVMNDFRVPMADVPFYIKGVASDTNNQVTGDIAQLEVGRVPVPKSIINTYQPALADFVTDGLSRLPGLNVEKAAFENGKFTFKGTLPDKELTVNK